MTASSATCSACHPRASAWDAASWVTENRHGTNPSWWALSENAARSSERSSARAATGSHSPRATPAWTR